MAIVGPAQRRQVVAAERPGRRGAGDRRRSGRDHARRDRHRGELARTRLRFVDTAGMRKAAKVSGVEYYAVPAQPGQPRPRPGRRGRGRRHGGPRRARPADRRRGDAARLRHGAGREQVRRGGARPRRGRRHGRPQAAPAAPGARRVGAHRSRTRAPAAGSDRSAEPLYCPHPDGRPEPGALRHHRTAHDAGQGTQEAEALLHLPVPDGAAALCDQPSTTATS